MACGDRRRAAAPDDAFAARFGGGIARRAFQKLGAAQQRIAGILGFDGSDVGGIDPAQFAIGPAHPDGIGDGVEQAAQRLEFGNGARQPVAQAQGFEAIAGNVADAHHGAAADGAPVDFEGPPAKALDRAAEAFAARPELVDANLELLGGIRRQPGSERENAARHRRVGHEAEIAFDFGLAARAAPGDDDLRLGGEKHFGAVELGAQIVEFEQERRFGFRPAAVLAQVKQRGDRREQHEPDDQREPNHDVLIFAQVLQHEQRVIGLREGRRGDRA